MPLHVKQCRPRRWRDILQGLPLPVGNLTIWCSWPFPHLNTAPLQISSLNLEVNPEDSYYVPLLQSLLDSAAVRRHSAASLRSIRCYTTFTLSDAQSATFTNLTSMERLSASNAAAAGLPAGLRSLMLQDGTLDAAALAHLTALTSLQLSNVEVRRSYDGTSGVSRCFMVVMGQLSLDVHGLLQLVV